MGLLYFFMIRVISGSNVMSEPLTKYPGHCVRQQNWQKTCKYKQAPLEGSFGYYQAD